MGLNEFREIDLQWTHSTMRFFEVLRAASSDDKGRKLVAQVLIGNDASKVALRLYWKNKDGSHGFHNFNLIDANKAIFDIYYPRDLLENKGKVSAWLHMTDSTGSITSEGFIINVFEGIDTQGIEASDSLLALTEALTQINRYQADIDGILNGLEAEYAAFTSGIQTQFNDAMANLTVDSEVIAARTSTATGDTFTTVGNRIDNAENMIILGSHKAYFEIDNGYPRLRLEEI